MNALEGGRYRGSDKETNINAKRERVHIEGHKENYDLVPSSNISRLQCSYPIYRNGIYLKIIKLN